MIVATKWLITSTKYSSFEGSAKAQNLILEKTSSMRFIIEEYGGRNNKLYYFTCKMNLIRNKLNIIYKRVNMICKRINFGLESLHKNIYKIRNLRLKSTYSVIPAKIPSPKINPPSAGTFRKPRRTAEELRIDSIVPFPSNDKPVSIDVPIT